MLKTTILLQMLIFNEVLAADEIDGVKSGDQLIEKCGKFSKIGKLSKSGNSKGKKSAKSKKLSKSGNSSNFDVTEADPSFLTCEARIAFHSLRLAFINAPIIWYLDPECYI